MNLYIISIGLLILLILIMIMIMIVLIIRNRESFETNTTDFKISMFLTGGLKEEAENCIQTLKTQKLDDKLIVTALDDEAYEHISKLGVKTEKRKTNLKREADFGTKNFYEITINKLYIIKNHLEKHKQIVIYTDTDIVFLKDITDDIRKFDKSNYDIMIQNDVPNFDDSNKNNLCTGFIFFKPNQKSIKCLEKAIKHMKDNWEKRGGGRLADQNSFNIVLKNEDIKLAILDLKDYPNGSRYFNNINSIYKNYTPKIVHNNYIVGTKNKIERFKKNGLWFIK